MAVNHRHSLAYCLHYLDDKKLPVSKAAGNVVVEPDLIRFYHRNRFDIQTIHIVRIYHAKIF